ncbi:acyltransferase [Flavobacteriaceae bacterium Ap0902]|nr:acyltransferase [Flavobacteriaceae bacterium Ap0902]
MNKFLWTQIFKLAGWKIKGNFPKGLKKAIIVAGPHTSNWDFPLGLGTRAIGGFPANFMIKDSWTKLPILGKGFLAMGAVPVSRSKGRQKKSLTELTIEEMKERDEFVLCIAPEGTRKYQPKLKSGFWHIAKEANIPIVPMSFDYPTKTVYWNKPMMPSNSKEADIAKIEKVLGQYTGKFPEQGIKPKL